MHAVVKKDLGKVKAGTVLHFTGGVFAHKGSTFMAEDVMFDEVHFEVVDTTPAFSDVLIDETRMSVGAPYPTIDLAASFLRANLIEQLG